MIHRGAPLLKISVNHMVKYHLTHPFTIHTVHTAICNFGVHFNLNLKELFGEAIIKFQESRAVGFIKMFTEESLYIHKFFRFKSESFNLAFFSCNPTVLENFVRKQV